MLQKFILKPARAVMARLRSIAKNMLPRAVPMVVTAEKAETSSLKRMITFQPLQISDIKENMQPPPVNGVAELREAIARHLYGFRGLSVSPDCIVVGAGTEYLYTLIIQLLGFQNTFAVEDPGYSKIARVYQACAVRCVPVPLDAQGINLTQLAESGANVAHISPSHHFPTGRTTTIGRRYELLRWAAAASDRYIIEDDCDAEFRLNGRTIPTLRSIDTTARVLYLNTFTKTLSPTIRISYLVLPAPLMAQFRQKLGFYASTVATMHQLTLALFMREGHFESHINRQRRRYRELKDHAVAAVRRQRALHDAAVLEADAGVYFLLRLPTTKSDAQLRNAARRYGLEIAFLSDYSALPADVSATATRELAHTVIVQYASLTPAALEEALHRLALAVAE